MTLAPPVQAGFDTWADSAHTSTTHGDDKSLHVASGTERPFIHTAIPAPTGSTVVSALFTVYAKGASTGARTLTLRRVIEPWKARTLNWNNQPAVTDTGLVNVTIGDLADGAPVSFDVRSLVQAVVSGTATNYGWRISSSSGGDHRFYSAQAGVKNPTLLVEYVEGPATPTGLLPAGGLVGVAQPTLQWKYAGVDDLASYRVQADPSASETTPAYDSGLLPATAGPVHALNGTSFADLAADGAVTYWRVQVTDTAGQLSDWSDWVSMTRDDKGVLTLNNPAAPTANYLSEPTPPILFTLTDEPLTAFRVLITQQADHNAIVVDSGKLAGTTGAWTVPVHPTSNKPYLLTGGSYAVCVRAYDAKQRQGSAAAGDQPYVEVWRDFTMVDDAGVTSPSLTSVTQYGVTPAATVTFARGTAPDAFVVLRDGVEIATGLLPGDLFVSGTTYAYHDWTAHPRTAHSYRVKAVVNGVQSQPSGAVALTGGTQVDGVWIIDPNTATWFRCVAIDGSSGADQWAQVEVGTDYLPVGSRTGFRITQTLGGLAGSYVGALKPYADRTVEQMAADLFTIKEAAPHTTDFRLVGDYLNIPASLSNLVCSVWEGRPVTGTRRRASFGFAQTGEFEFDGKV